MARVRYKRENCLTEELAKSDDQKVADVLECVKKKKK
jgi:hypothetical protein